MNKAIDFNEVNETSRKALDGKVQLSLEKKNKRITGN